MKFVSIFLVLFVWWFIVSEVKAEDRYNYQHTATNAAIQYLIREKNCKIPVTVKEGYWLNTEVDEGIISSGERYLTRCLEYYKNTYKLTWTPPSEREDGTLLNNESLTYQIYIQTKDGPVMVGETKDLSYEYTPDIVGEKVIFMMRAIDANGMQSEFSKSVEVE